MNASMSSRGFAHGDDKAYAQVTQGNFGIDVSEAEGGGFDLQVRAPSRCGQVTLVRVVGAVDPDGVSVLTVTPYEPYQPGGGAPTTRPGQPAVIRSPDAKW